MAVLSSGVTSVRVVRDIYLRTVNDGLACKCCESHTLADVPSLSL